MDQVFPGTIHKVYAWKGAKTQAQIEALMAASDEGVPPIFQTGDSFLNGNTFAEGGGLLDSIRVLTAGKYAMFVDDGVGGTSLTQQAARFAALPTRYRDCTFLGMEIGLDGTGEEFVAALTTIRSLLTHDRWLCFEPVFDTNKRVGTQARTNMDGYIATIQSHLSSIGKSDRWAATKAGMQAAARGGNATDLADIADDIWPSDTTYWTTDGLHQRKPGQDALAAIIVAAVQAKGWL